MVIGDIVATTKTTRCCRGTSDVFFSDSMLMFALSISSNIGTKEDSVSGRLFALSVQCANKYIDIDEHLSVAKLFNAMVKPLTVPAFSKLKFIEIFAAVSLSSYLFSNLMHTTKISLSLCFRFFVFFILSLVFLFHFLR